MNFFINPISLTIIDFKIRDAIISELTEIDTIIANLDGRTQWNEYKDHN
jgi:hypothetical protein